jgi:hypothetical protein
MAFWHFRIPEKPGYTDLPDSYIKYLADRLNGLDFNASLVDKVTRYVFFGGIYNFTISERQGFYRQETQVILHDSWD